MKKTKLSQKELRAFVNFWTSYDDISPYIYKKWEDTAIEQIMELIDKYGGKNEKIKI